MAYDPMLDLDFTKMEPTEVLAVLRGDSRVNHIRRIISVASAKIEQAQQQRKAISSIDVKRLEFQCAQEILRLFEENV